MSNTIQTTKTGGRGKKAPYETTHVRVPVPVKDKVMKVIDAFHKELNGTDQESDENLLTDKPKLLTSLEAIEIAQKLLGQKKSARVSMEKLLSAIYCEPVNL